MVWSILGFSALLLLLVLGGLVGFWLVRVSAHQYAREVKLARDGRVVKAWVVFFDLEPKSSPGSWGNVLLVCTLEQLPNLEQTLEQWANAVRHFQPVDLSQHEEL